MSRLDDYKYVQRNVELPLLEKGVLLALLGRCDDALTCWPSTETIGREAGCTSRTVRRALQKLIARKLVMVESRSAESGVSSSNLYRLHLPGRVTHGPPTRTDRPPRVNDSPGEGDAASGGRRTHGPGEADTPSAEVVQVKSPPEETKLSVSAPRSPRKVSKGKTVAMFVDDVGEAEPKEPSNHARVVEAFVAAYQRTHNGTKPTFNGKPGIRMFKAAKELLEALDVETATATVSAAFDDPWFVKAHSTLMFIADNVDRFKRSPPPAPVTYSAPSSSGTGPPPAGLLLGALAGIGAAAQGLEEQQRAGMAALLAIAKPDVEPPLTPEIEAAIRERRREVAAEQMARWEALNGTDTPPAS